MDSVQVKEDEGCCHGSYTDYPFATLTWIIVILFVLFLPVSVLRQALYAVFVAIWFILVIDDKK